MTNEMKIQQESRIIVYIEVWNIISTNGYINLYILSIEKKNNTTTDITTDVKAIEDISLHVMLVRQVKSISIYSPM